MEESPIHLSRQYVGSKDFLRGVGGWGVGGDKVQYWARGVEIIQFDTCPGNDAHK